MRVKNSLKVILLSSIMLCFGSVYAVTKSGGEHKDKCPNASSSLVGCEPTTVSKEKSSQAKTGNKSTKVTEGEPTNLDNSYVRSKTFLMNHD